MALRTVLKSGMSRKAQSEIISAVILSGIAVMVVSSAYFWGAPLIEKNQASSRLSSAENMMSKLASAVEDVSQQGGQISMPVNLEGPMKVSDEGNSIEYEISTRSLNIASTDWVPLNGKSPVRQETHVIEADGGEQVTLGESTCSVDPDCSAGLIIKDCAGGDYAGGTYKDKGFFSAGGKTYTVAMTCGGEYYDAIITGPEQLVAGYVGADKPGVIVARSFPEGDGFSNRYKLVYRELDDLDTKEGYFVDIRPEGNAAGEAGQHSIIIKRGEQEITPKGSAMGGSLTTTPVLVSIQ